MKLRGRFEEWLTNLIGSEYVIGEGEKEERMELSAIMNY